MNAAIRAATEADIDAVLDVWERARSVAARTPRRPGSGASACSTATPARSWSPRLTARSSAC